MHSNKLMLTALVALGSCSLAQADAVLYYDSGGFEAADTSALTQRYTDVYESASTARPYAPTPQLESLFDNATIETIHLGGAQYPAVPAGNQYALGMVGSTVNGGVFNTPTVADPDHTTTNYDALALKVDVSTCRNIESVTVNFDLSLSALTNATNPLRPYYPAALNPPSVTVKLFDAAVLTSVAAFNTPIDFSTVSGTATDPSTPFTMNWTPQSVTIPLTATMLSGSNAYVTLSGAGALSPSLTAGLISTPYIALDNLVIYRNTPAGTGCLGPVSVPVPTTNPWGLWLMAALVLGLAGWALRGRASSSRPNSY